jgi:hypothetical protein
MSTKIHKRLALAIVLLRLLGCGPPSKVGSVEGVQRSEAQSWKSPRCLIHQGCRVAASPPPPCVEELPTLSVPELVQQGQTLAGQRVRVHGPLRLSLTLCTLGACLHGECCNECTREMVLGEPGSSERSVRLLHPICRGDDSKVCCDLQASGQDVVVEGKLVSMRDSSRWLTSQPAWAYTIESGTDEPPRVCSRSATGP